MSIHYIILGYLSTSSLTGYELKKAIAAHPYLPWRGNNNQIYKSLIDLEGQGFIKSETVIQSLSPNKKIYHINHAGRALLRHWLYEPVLPVEFNNPLLVKLQFADEIKRDAWIEIFTNYRQELQDRLYMQKLMPVPQLHSKIPDSSAENMAALCNQLAMTYARERLEAEINLVNQFIDLVRTLGPARLADLPQGQTFRKSTKKSLSVHLLQGRARPILELTGEGPGIGSEQDALDLLALCGQHQAQRILASTSLFQDDFFRLKTGLAGVILQKLANDQIRLALVRQPEQKIKGKFIEFMNESNLGSHFAVMDNREEAINWLIQ